MNTFKERVSCNVAAQPSQSNFRAVHAEVCLNHVVQSKCNFGMLFRRLGHLMSKGGLDDAKAFNLSELQVCDESQHH